MGLPEISNPDLKLQLPVKLYIDSVVRVGFPSFQHSLRVAEPDWSSV